MAISTTNAIGYLSGKLIEARKTADLEIRFGKLESHVSRGKNYICQMIFLNFVVDTEKVVDYQMREPFATLLKTRNVLNGRGERTRTFDLTVPNRARYQLRHTPMVFPR